MVRSRSARIGVIAAVAPLLIMVGLRSAWALYSCPTDGPSRAACCCPSGHAQARAHARRAASPDPAIAAACCEIDAQAPTRAPELQAPARADGHAPPPAVAIAADVLPPPRAPVPARADRAQARPPPLATFLDKQSLLR